MPRFFFDIHDGQLVRDEDGVELPDMEAVRRHAMLSLPEIACHEIAKGGDRQTFVVVVSDEDGRAVFSATLNYTGQSLIR